MEGYTFEKYAIKIDRKPDGMCSVSFEPSVGKAFDKNGRKIYIVSSGKEVLYVGEANTSIKTRFRRGCFAFNHHKKTGESLNGYRGYKWLDTNNHKKPLLLNVVIFDEKYSANETRIVIEAIEGEIVYLIRHRLKQWPAGQNEIHFSNINGTLEKAKAIYNKIK